MQDVGVNKERGHQCPHPAVQEVVVAEDEVLLSESWVLPPSPQAGRYAREYQERVGFQGRSRRTLYEPYPILKAVC